MKSLCFFGLIVLAAATLRGQTYWSTDPNVDCSGTNAAGFEVNGPIAFSTPTGGLGYVCQVTGTFMWYAAGAGWTTSIRVAAPESAPILADYKLVGIAGNPLSLDTTFGPGSAVSPGTEVSASLNPNQPLEVDLLGHAGDGPNYSHLAGGSVYATFLCPDGTTCSLVYPQLVYSALPAASYSLSVALSWDGLEQYQWSVEGMDDGPGGAHQLSFAIYNADTTAASYTIQVYDSNGNLAGTGTTNPISPLHNDTYGTGGVTAFQDLSSVITSPLPSGILKVVFSGSNLSDVIAIQFTNEPNGQQSATTLQLAQDATPGASSDVRRARAASTPKRVPGAPAK